jgi:hypothetical protein
MVQAVRRFPQSQRLLVQSKRFGVLAQGRVAEG